MQLVRSDSPKSPFDRIRCSVCGQPPARMEVVPVLLETCSRGYPELIASGETVVRVDCCSHTLCLSSLAGVVPESYFERRKRA